jgi:Spy/CpxP family protein refolding chaperone
VAALLLVPASGGASDWCGKDQPPQQQRGADPVAGHSKDGKDSDHKPQPKWWIDPQLRAELGVTDAQSAAVEEVWQKSLPLLRDRRGQLEKQEDTLSQMIAAEAAEPAIIAQIDKIENMRAELAKGRTLMIYRMNKVLRPEQRAKVKAMMERRDSDRRGSTPR